MLHQRESLTWRLCLGFILSFLWLDSRERHPELLLGDDDGPRLPAVAEHLLGVDEPAPGQDLVPDALRGGALRGDDGLLGAVEVGHEDPRRLRLGVRGRMRGREAAELDGAGRVGVLGLAAVALRQELHRRGLPRVHRAVFHHHLGKELAMSIFAPLAAGPDAFVLFLALSPQPPFARSPDIWLQREISGLVGC